MIKRLSKHNDYKDIIKSCPSGVIDDIYAIDYYIQGHNETIQANFEKKGDLLEVILPSTDLETLPNGILMRRAYYKVLDASYPDGYYNLQFEDNMNVWLGEVESEEPVIPEYVTEEELAETLGDYVSDDELAETLGGYASQSWVEGQGYLTSASMSGYATEQWVENELMTGGYLTEYMADQRYPTFSWIESNGYATETWVSSQGYAVNDPNDPVITESVLTSVLDGDDNKVVREDDLASYATQSWVEGQGYLTSASMSGYATESYVQNQGYITSSALSGYATEQWVENQGYLTSASMSGYATETWVQNQGYAVEDPTNPFVTESAMNAVLAGNGDRVVRESDISGFATESYVDQAIEDAISGSEIPIPENVVEYDVHHPLIEDFGYNVDVLKRPTFDYERYGEVTGCITKGLVLAYEEEYEAGAVVAMNTVEIRDGLLATVSYTFGEEGGLPDYHENRSYYATEDWVENQGYLTSDALAGYATESWVSSQGYLTSASMSGYATQSWVSQQGYITSSALSGYATESYVQNQGYITSSALSGYATESWVQEQGYAAEDPDNRFVTEYDLDNCVQFTGSGLGEGVATISDYGDDVALNSLATSSDRIKTVLIHKDSIAGRVDAGVARYDLNFDGWAQAWFDPFITENALSTELSGYATETWVGQQGYITSTALSGYATQSWATNQFLEESKVWSGTQAQWNQLTAAQQASYTIALITQ